MLIRMLCMLSILLSANLKASEFPIEIIEYVDNTKIVVFINESDIDKKLHWQPYEEPIPFSITDALKALQKHFVIAPDLKQAKVTEIELKQIPRHPKNWHYVIKMKSKINNKAHNHYLVVLMNGKVIAGLKEPEAYK